MTRTPRPEFRPDASLSRDAMERQQRSIAAAARFTDDLRFDPKAVAIDEAFDLTTGLPDATPDAGDPDTPVVVGIDQAFLPGSDGKSTDRAVSAVVAIRDGTVVEYAHAVTPLAIPYVPGLLAFREGAPMLAALDSLSLAPDLLVCDGSGRIHFREAGIATHIGVIQDRPSIGVAKRLLCGEPTDPVAERPAGWRTPICADTAVETASSGTTIGYAYQSRQYPNSRRVNPLYVSPGHRVSTATTVALVAAMSAGYKLPEPTRLADAYADQMRQRVGGSERQADDD